MTNKNTTEKPSGTSAATTAFCCEKIEGPGGLHLWLDGNGKITAGNGTLYAPKPNAFSLAHLEDCPGSTESCRASCYVHGLKAAIPDTYKLYQHNSLTIRTILAKPYFGITWSYIMAEWIAANATGGFRWHVSGDVFSEAYGEFIAEVCRKSPYVRHWIYTRSFDTAIINKLLAVSTARGGNLAINISADKDNYKAACEVAKENNLSICYMATKDGKVPALKDGDVIFPDYNLRGGSADGQQWFGALPSAYRKMVCPVDYHGKSEQRRCGPCSRCLT